MPLFHTLHTHLKRKNAILIRHTGQSPLDICRLSPNAGGRLYVVQAATASGRFTTGLQHQHPSIRGKTIIQSPQLTLSTQRKAEAESQCHLVKFARQVEAGHRHQRRACRNRSSTTTVCDTIKAFNRPPRATTTVGRHAVPAKPNNQTVKVHKLYTRRGANNTAAELKPT